MDVLHQQALGVVPAVLLGVPQGSHRRRRQRGRQQGGRQLAHSPRSQRAQQVGRQRAQREQYRGPSHRPHRGICQYQAQQPGGPARQPHLLHDLHRQRAG